MRCSLVPKQLSTSVRLPCMVKAQARHRRNRGAAASSIVQVPVLRVDAKRQLMLAASEDDSQKHVTTDEMVDLMFLYGLNCAILRNPEEGLKEMVRVLPSGMVSSFMMGRIHHEDGASQIYKEKDKVDAAHRLIRLSLRQGQDIELGPYIKGLVKEGLAHMAFPVTDDNHHVMIWMANIFGEKPADAGIYMADSIKGYMPADVLFGSAQYLVDILRGLAGMRPIKIHCQEVETPQQPPSSNFCGYSAAYAFSCLLNRVAQGNDLRYERAGIKPLKYSMANLMMMRTQLLVEAYQAVVEGDMEIRKIVDGIKDPLTAHGYRHVDAADYDTTVLKDQNEAFEKFTPYRDDIRMTRSKSPMPSRSATPAPVKLKKDKVALPSLGVYGADSGSLYTASKEASDEDDAADAEMTELESAGPEALPRTVGKKCNAFVFRGDNTGHKGKKSKTKHADALADAAAALLRLVGADDVDPISATDWTELERQGVDEVLLSLLKEQTQTNLVLKQAVMLMARGVAAVEANAMSQRLPSRPGREELLSREHIKAHVFGPLKSLARKEPYLAKGQLHGLYFLVYKVEDLNGWRALFGGAAAGEAAFRAIDKVVVPHLVSNIRGKTAAALRDLAAREYVYPGNASAADASPDAQQATEEEWITSLLDEKDNKWLGTNSNLLGTDAWAKFVVTYHNKMSTDHKVPCLGAGGVALRIYEKGLAFILFQVKRGIKGDRGDRGGLAGKVNLMQQHLQQHAEYVQMLKFVRTIINSGDCMLGGTDGTVEIHATDDDVRAANRAAAKALEGLDENDKRYRDSKTFL